jgi:hypothetical protein
MSKEDVERLRRSLAMLTPGQPATVLKREQALELLGELQRVQGLLEQAVKRLRITLGSLEDEHT